MVAVALLTTKAAMRSPYPSSGTPMTATSSTGWCLEITSSISRGKMFTPPEMIMSFLRSMMEMKPSSSLTAMSPTVKYPSSSYPARVASSSRR